MMLTPCWPSAGPIGGAGVAWPALICSLMTAETFFLGGMSGPNGWLAGGSSRRLGDRRDGEGSDLGDLVERQLDRRLAPEDGDRKSTRLNSSHANISYAVFCL